MIKKIWNELRITVVMIRKGLVSKRKFIMGMNMIVKRRKLVRRTLRNLTRSHSREEEVLSRCGFGLREYEFSCRNSPSPERRISVIPCMNLPRAMEGIEEGEGVEDRYYDQKAGVLVPKTPDYFDEKLSPLLTYNTCSPFSVMICDYSTEDDCEDEGGKVDDEAEEFIRRFREQLRMQLLQ